jgi:hypothetical protein
MHKAVDKLSDKAISVATEYIHKSAEDLKLKTLWKKAVEKTCIATEGVKESFTDIIVNSIAIQRYFAWLTSDKSLNGIYRSFVISIAVELCPYDAENKLAISFGTAILDNWFELNGIEYSDLKKQLDMSEVAKIICDRENLYREYFMLYDDPMACDIVRVYYPKNGEEWISWEKEYSIDIKLNLSRGAAYGFCKTGFAYSRVRKGEDEKFLAMAYIDEDRELLRFDGYDIENTDKKTILWIK